MEDGCGFTHTKQDRVVQEARGESRVPFRLEAQVTGVTLPLLQTRLPHVGPQNPHLANSTPLVLHGRGERQGSCSRLACRWHVVNLPGLRGK